MSTPQEPGRPEDQSGYPDAPPPPDPGQYPQYPQGSQYPQGPGQTSHQAPDQPPYAGGPTGGQAGGSYGNAPTGGSYGNAPTGGSYGNAPAYDPYASPGFGTQPTGANLAPPREVIWATYAMYAAIALSLINLIVTLADSTGYKDAIRDADPNRTVDVDAVYTAAVVFAVVVTLLIAALYVFLAINLRKGKNWARIVTWIVVGIFTLLGLIGLGGDVPGIARLLGILVLLANASTLVLLALRPSNQFFAAMRQPRY
jgi:hypothetical protein